MHTSRRTSTDMAIHMTINRHLRRRTESRLHLNDQNVAITSKTKMFGQQTFATENHASGNAAKWSVKNVAHDMGGKGWQGIAHAITKVMVGGAIAWPRRRPERPVLQMWLAMDDATDVAGK